MDDKLQRLEAAGFRMSLLPAEQQQVLADLSEEEVGVLVEISQRLADATPDVQAHGGEIVGGIFF